MRFDEAIDFFPNSYFDFIFIDGFAHTGENDGKTMHDWYPKLAPGGILAGHYYDARWPRVIEAVDRFIAGLPGLELFRVNENGLGKDPLDDFNDYGSWFTVKPL